MISFHTIVPRVSLNNVLSVMVKYNWNLKLSIRGIEKIKKSGIEAIFAGILAKGLLEV